MNKLIFIIFLFLTSCGLTKKINKKDTDTTEKQEIVSQTKREGDTVTFFVPKMVLKDTTIYTVNRVGTRIETRYNNQGEIDRIDCMSSSIEELTKINRELITTISEKEKDEEFKMDKTFVIGILIIVGVFFIGLAAYVIFKLQAFSRLLP